MMELIEGIHSRRSVRSYRDEPVSEDDLRQILLAGSQAPSGLNNQPWRFVTIRGKSLQDELSALTRYRHIVASAPLLIAVFLDRESVYHEMKDYQGIGSCIQNMLLAAHGLGLGAVWLGEILKNAGEVRSLLGLSERYDLMAVIAVGHPADTKGDRTSRLPLDQLLLKEF